MREDFDRLTSGKMVEKAIKHELTYREMDKIQNIYSFLLFTGYLKVIKYIDRKRVYTSLDLTKKSAEFIPSYLKNGFRNKRRHMPRNSQLPY